MNNLTYSLLPITYIINVACSNCGNIYDVNHWMICTNCGKDFEPEIDITTDDKDVYRPAGDLRCYLSLNYIKGMSKI